MVNWGLYYVLLRFVLISLFIQYLAYALTRFNNTYGDFFFCLNLQEAVVIPPLVAFAVRPNPGIWEFVKVNSIDLAVEAITTSDYLKYKEMVSDEKWYVILVSLVWSVLHLNLNLH